MQGGAINLINSWVNYDDGYALASYKLVNGICYLQGLVKRSPIHHNCTIALLPVECRPQGRLIFTVSNHNYNAPGGGSLRVDILANGEIVFVGGDKHHDWLSLSGISFIV